MSEESLPPTLLPEGYYYHPWGYLWHILPKESFANLPEDVPVDGQDFHLKPEFHVTVINARKVAEEIAGDDKSNVPDLEEKLQLLLSEYLKENIISFV